MEAKVYESLKEFAKAMGHNPLALDKQFKGEPAGLDFHNVKTGLNSALSKYKQLVGDKDYFGMVGNIDIEYLHTDKGFVAMTINGQYPFYFCGKDFYVKTKSGEYSQCYTIRNRRAYMWEFDMPYIILFANALSNVDEFVGDEIGVVAKWASGYTLHISYNWNHSVFRGAKRGISFANAMKRGDKANKWLKANVVKVS